MLTGNAGTSDLVGMPAVHDLGSLQEETRLIANVRIHVERVIGVTRGRFKMLKGPICWRLQTDIYMYVCGNVAPSFSPWQMQMGPLSDFRL